MDPEYGGAYENLFNHHWWWRAREDFISTTLSRFKPQGGWDGILDVGCGNGLSFGWLSGFGRPVYGVEVDRRLVRDDNPQRDRIHVGRFDASYQPPMSFSLVTMLDVVEHMENPSEALLRARAVSRPGGHLLITVPAFQTLWTSHDEINHHYTRYTKRTLASLLDSIGLRVLHDQYFFHWVAPAKLVTRVKERVFGTSSPSIPKVPTGWLNKTLLTISRAEQLLPSWTKPPFGSSLLLMGRFPE